jgi:ubiquinone biosynthesis protein Coq4
MSDINAQVQQNLLKTAASVFRLIQDSTDLQSVFAINDSLRNTEAMVACIQYLESIPEVAELMAERYVAPNPDLEALAQLPPDSLGYQYANMLIQGGFKAVFFPQLPSDDPLDYVRLRVRQTHDIWHVVTGFGTDELGEIAVQAFGLAQMHYPTAALILLSGVISAIKHPENFEHTTQKISEGYNLGQHARPFLGQKWELAWEKPVAQWRTDLNVSLST